ncbi:hypothetical protein GCM10027020_23350 [Nocardioides salsibiostraticola]
MATLVTAGVALTGSLLAPVSPAAAVDFGGSTRAAPNVNYGCEAGPRLQNANGDYGVWPSGTTSCTWVQLPTFNQNGIPVQPSGLAPGRGRVTAVSVRSGPNPAPLRFTVVRAYIARDGNGGVPSQGAAACCFGEQMTRSFGLRPNAVTNIALNLPVETGYDPINNVDIADYVGISATSNTGTLPVRVTSNPPNSSQTGTPGNPSTIMLYPQINPREERTDSFSAPSHLITARFTMCTGGAAGRVAAGTSKVSASSCGARMTTGRIAARNGKVKVPLKSVGSAKGKIAIKTAKGGKQLAKTKRFSIGPRGKSRVAVKLTGLGKKATRGKRSVRAKIIIRSQGTTTTKKFLLK